MAPALVKNGHIYMITDAAYASLDNAHNSNIGSFIKWPANENLWVEVEVDDE